MGVYRQGGDFARGAPPEGVSVVRASVTALLILASSFSFASHAPLLMFRDAGAMGMGNAFEAAGSGLSGAHYNPASLAELDEPQFELLLFRSRASLDLISELKEIDDLTDNAGDLLQSEDPLGDESLEPQRRYLVGRLERIMEERLAGLLEIPSLAAAFPFKFGIVKLVLGGSIYWQGYLSFHIERRGIRWADRIKEMLDNPIVYNISSQTVCLLLAAAEIPLGPTKLQIGLSARRMGRSVFSDEDDPMTIEDVLNPYGPDGVPNTADDFKSRYFDYEEEDKLKLIKEAFERWRGRSVDIGAAFEPVEGVRVAWVMRNLFGELEGPGGSKRIPRNNVISAALKPLRLLNVEYDLLDLTLGLSYDNPNGDDALGSFRNNAFSDHIHLGVEAVILPGRRFSVAGRLGNNQGYPTVGVSAKIGGLIVDLVRYGDLRADWNVLSVKAIF